MSNRVYITECPRDAMQGLTDFIPTSEKVGYLNQLLAVGFDVLDFGSFVSPKAIPQLRDTSEVIEQLDLTNTKTKLLAIVANLRGAQDAAAYNVIDVIGFPFSISETFQQRNTNKSIADSFQTVQAIRDTCSAKNKTPLVYISMAFGNPYNEPWNEEIALGWIAELHKTGINHIALADTVGIATPEEVFKLTKATLEEFKNMQIGVHLHCQPDNWKEKAAAAYSAGCRHFDSAIRGFGGCPMAKDKLVGNMPTEKLIQYLDQENVITGINSEKFNEALNASSSIFLAHS